MTEEISNGEKARQIVSLLPKENCDKCGFENCGKFALAVIKGKAAPFGCHKNPSAGYEISKVLGIEVTEESQVPAGYPEFPHRSKGLGHRYSCGHGLGHHRHGCGHGRGREGYQHPGRHHARRQIGQPRISQAIRGQSRIDIAHQSGFLRGIGICRRNFSRTDVGYGYSEHDNGDCRNDLSCHHNHGSMC